MEVSNTGRWVSLAERPDLLASAYGFDEQERSASFMQHDRVAELATAKRISELWPEFFLVLVMPEGSVGARAVSIPFSTDAPDRGRLPDSGWDGAVMWCVQDALDGRRPTAACALEIAVDPRLRGRGLGVDALHALRLNAGRLGLAELVGAFLAGGARPCGLRTRRRSPGPGSRSTPPGRGSDGLPSDRWLRVHVRAGGRVDRIAPFSMVVVGTLDQWREWTGLPFDRDGLLEVRGGRQPVVVSQELGSATYTEPNIWVRHPTR